MEKSNEIERILLDLNCKSFKDQTSIEICKLIKKGYEISNLWQTITTFQTEREFYDKTTDLLKVEVRIKAMDYVNAILDYRRSKVFSISQMDYRDCKIYCDLEVLAMKDLLMYLKNGSEEMFCLVNDRVIDKLNLIYNNLTELKVIRPSTQHPSLMRHKKISPLTSE